MRLAVRTLPNALVVVLMLTAGLGVLAVPSAQAQDLPGGVYAVDGTVSIENGSAVEEAKVTIEPDGGGEARTVLTGSDGGYAFDGLAAGTYNLSASHACCMNGFQQVSIGSTTLSATIDFQLVAQPAPPGEKVVRISGRAFDAATDDALAGVNLYISNYYQPEGDKVGATTIDGGGSSQWFNVVTDHDGTYALDVGAGSLHIQAELNGYDFASGSFSVQNDTVIDVPMRASEAGSVTLSGVLRDTSGAALAGGWVSVSPDYRSYCDGDVCWAEASPSYVEPDREGAWYYESHQGGYDSTETGKDGSWSLTTQPGDLRLYASGPGEYLPAEKRIQAEEGESKTVDLVLTPIPPDSVRIVGQVRDANDGSPIPYAQVSVENQQWGRYNWSQTDEDGMFEVWTKPGYTIIQVYAGREYWMPCDYGGDRAVSSSGGSDGVSIAQPMPACEPVERAHGYFPRVLSLMAEADSTVSRDFDLVRAPDPDAVFQGWLVNATSDKGIPNATVTFYNELTRDWGQATTDADGSYKILVHAGYYTVRAYADGYFDAVLNTDIESGQTKTVTLEMEPGQKRYGCCFHYYGAPERGMAVDAASSDGAPGGQGQESAEGGAPPTPDGVQVYEGEGGGLGPYDARGGDGSESPGLGALAVLIGVLAAIGLSRRRR
jgi:hypothetical protein